LFWPTFRPASEGMKKEKPMSTTTAQDERTQIGRDVGIEGLRFRNYEGEEDLPAMLAVIEGSKGADGLERTQTLDDLRRDYAHLTNSNPATDVFLAEVQTTATTTRVVGYSRVWWNQVVGGPLVLGHFAFLLPAWRETGIRAALVHRNEERLRAIAAEHDSGAESTYECWAQENEKDWIVLLEREGYRPIRYGYGMVRRDLDRVPSHPMPEGLEVRPVMPEHYPQIWDAAREAFRDHWGFSEEEWAYSNFASWQKSPTFNPALWQVAWAEDEVAGMILNFIDEAENKEYDRRRGYTETICVRRPWRRRGLARALIARSLAMHRELGMTEAALGVDALNPNGALALYESMGYTVFERETVYRKPLDAEQAATGRSKDENHT
jgi:mycothiol synthase